MREKKAEEPGEIEIILVDESKEVISQKKHSFNQGDTLEKILNENYDIIIDKGMITKIDSIVTPDTSQYFIKIYCNDSMSTKGIKTMVINNGDVIKFVYTKVGDYSE